MCVNVKIIKSINTCTKISSLFATELPAHTAFLRVVHKEVGDRMMITVIVAGNKGRGKHPKSSMTL